MNSISELMDKIDSLRRQRTYLFCAVACFSLVIGGLALTPSQSREILKENALLKRYAIRLEKQNEIKDRAFMNLIEKTWNEKLSEKSAK